jgi:hypothetical protein
MDRTHHSPRITHVSWGHLEIDDGRSFKDAKLYPGGGREWNWRETGTEHDPGIQPVDVQELLDHGATVVVLSKGMMERLQVEPETIRMLEEQNVAVHVLPTKEAVREYNALREKEPVGGLFHSTC